MTIPVVLEEDTPRSLPIEHCAICGRMTRHWHKPKDVAVCRGCADTHQPADVPDKRTWCESPQGLGQMPDADVNADAHYDETRRTAAGRPSTT